MKIYLVSDGEYSGYRVIALFSSKKLAEKCIRTFQFENKVVSFDVDPEIINVPDGYTLFSVALSYDSGNTKSCISGSARWVYGETFLPPLDKGEIHKDYKGKRTFYITTIAKDRGHAIKIASEHLAKYKIEHPEEENHDSLDNPMDRSIIFAQK